MLVAFVVQPPFVDFVVQPPYVDYVVQAPFVDFVVQPLFLGFVVQLLTCFPSVAGERGSGEAGAVCLGSLRPEQRGGSQIRSKLSLLVSLSLIHI